MSKENESGWFYCGSKTTGVYKINEFTGERIKVEEPDDSLPGPEFIKIPISGDIFTNHS